MALYFMFLIIFITCFCLLMTMKLNGKILRKRILFGMISRRGISNVYSRKKFYEVNTSNH